MLTVRARGRLITIEGIDGAGKTTLAAALGAALRDRGVDVLVLREPGGVAASERVRELVMDSSLQIGARAEALLYAAARAQLVDEVLVPALDAGTWILLDRFVDSSLAYQGAGRGLGISAIRELNRFATGGLSPDRTLMLALDPERARIRAGGRPGEGDRLEREGDEFFRAVAAGYAELARAGGERIRTIDADRTPGEVLAAAVAALADLMPMAE